MLLLLMGTGGEIQPAYQISKICKTFAKSHFFVCIPRFAKSAATLISLGATSKLGKSWIRSGTAEVLFAEAFYTAFATAESLVRMGQKSI